MSFIFRSLLFAIKVNAVSCRRKIFTVAARLVEFTASLDTLSAPGQR